MAKVTIDNKTTDVPNGTNLVQAAKKIGVEIPVFCYHPKLAPVGMCRMCLVEIGTPKKSADGKIQTDEQGNALIAWLPKLQAACTTIVSDGMVARTAGANVADAQRGVLEFLLTSHPLDCPICDKVGECPLQNLTMEFGPGASRFPVELKFQNEKRVPLGDLIMLDRERCIQCARCIRFQDEIADDPALGFNDRGRGMEIVALGDPPFDSKFSGNTIDICPVGALTSRDFRL
ncbi:MAG: (2Fe-2S)-binding protein, partial [Chloroflexi bacterium]|nr:(2Fe-2S)-binding protein [Chloroflexota bacterium]